MALETTAVRGKMVPNKGSYSKQSSLLGNCSGDKFREAAALKYLGN
jgi:hypothetical protein